MRMKSLSYMQEMDLSLAFRDAEGRRAAWERHRDRLLKCANNGRRPLGWWQYDSSIPWPGHAREQSALYEAGLLGEEERLELEAVWYGYFEQAQVRDFSFCIGHRNPGDTFASWLYGDAAKRAHYRWADIPKSLVKQWTVEHRRRSRTICKLETAIQEGQAPTTDAVP